MGLYGNLRVESQRASPLFFEVLGWHRCFSGMSGQQPKDHFCPSTRRVGELGWEGDSTLVPGDPSSPVLGLITRLPVGKEGSGTKGSLGESKHQQGALAWMELWRSGWEEEAPAYGEQSMGTSGPAQ